MHLKFAIAMMVLWPWCVAEAQHSEFNTSGVYAKVMRLGSEITTAMSPDIAADVKKVTVDIMELGEVANDGSFTPLQLLSLLDLTYDLSGPHNADNVPDFTYLVAIVSVPNTNIVLSVNVAMFRSEGEMDIDGEKTAVAVGDVKIQMSISGDAITSVEDALLQLKVKVKGISSTPMLRTVHPGTDGVAYELGDGALVKLSKKVVDRSVTTTLNDQTLVLNEDSSFVIRFPRPLTNMRISYAWFIVPAPRDVTFSALGVHARMEGMKGTTKISLTPTIDEDANKAILTFTDFKVSDANNVVYNSCVFDEVRFKFDDVKNVTVSTSGIPAFVVKGVTKVLGGILEVNLYIFTSDGVVTYSGLEENVTVKAGDTRQELVLKGYTLEVGRFLDVTMDISGPSTLTLLVADDLAYNLGNNQAVHLSRKVWVGTEYRNMTTGYPTLQSGSSFVFRFPNFDGKTLTYDILVRKLENVAITLQGSIYVITCFVVISTFLF